jgi:hypothetical protein
MSLTDTLLGEAYALDVWIALRTDGAKGSGTENDPYNGAPRYEPALTVTELELAGSDHRVATATAANHGYSDNDVITISGATGADGKYYNGTFVIYGATANTFQYWMAGEPAGDAAGTITCARTHYRFDEVLPTIAANTAIHLGPGVFLTRGYRPGETIRIKTRQKIIGSGMGLTTLKLVNASVVDSAYAVIGTLPTGGELRHFEVSDITLDCNLDGQLIAGHDFAPIACAGIMASGAHLRYRRVRVIHFGSLKAGYECFALWSAGAHPNAGVESVDCVIEDCIVEHPAINQAEMTTCIHMGSEAIKQGPGIGIQGYHRASVIRNCLIDCEYKFNPVAISQLTRSGSTATATTLLPHGRAVGDWVRIAGAQVNGSLDNPFNGSFQITSATSTTFQYTMTATPAANASGDIWLDRFSSHLVENQSTPQVSQSGSEWIVSIVTKMPHYRVPGNTVLVKEAWGANTFNLFRVTSIPGGDPRKLVGVRATNPGQPTQSGFIGEVFQGISNDAGSAAVVENNRIFNIRIGGPYHDTGSTKDLVIRNNVYRNVVTGPFQAMGGNSGPIAVATLTHAGLIATLTTHVPHGLVPGQAVRIENSTINEDPPIPESYNDFYAVLSVSETQFTYEMKEDPGADADPGTGQVRALSQVGRWVVENNVIDLIPSYMDWGPPRAILCVVYSFGISGFAGIDPRVYRQLVIRNNVIRNMDGLPESPARNGGIAFTYCENALVENNVVDLPLADPIWFGNSTKVRFFNNRNSTGQLIQGTVGGVKQDELTTLIEEATVLAFL